MGDHVEETNLDPSSFSGSGRHLRTVVINCPAMCKNDPITAITLTADSERQVDLLPQRTDHAAQRARVCSLAHGDDRQTRYHPLYVLEVDEDSAYESQIRRCIKAIGVERMSSKDCCNRIDHFP